MTTTTVPDDIRLVGELYRRSIANGQEPAIVINRGVIDAPGRIGCTRCHRRPGDFVLDVFVCRATPDHSPTRTDVRNGPT